MEHKYYTPTIEEFHVGFEYEYKPILAGLNNERGEWKKVTFDFIPLSHIELEYTRVKHLDREDIESLGFILNVVDCGEDTQYNELGIRRNKEGGYFGTFFLDDTHGEYNMQIFESFYRIKNKSELKRLLKQLGIDA